MSTDNTKPMTFGRWMAACIAGQSGAKVMQIGYTYYNMDAIVKAAEEVDRLMLTCQMESRKMTPIENLMVEILIAQAGWKDLQDGLKSFERHLVRTAGA